MGAIIIKEGRGAKAKSVCELETEGNRSRMVRELKREVEELKPECKLNRKGEELEPARGHLLNSKAQRMWIGKLRVFGEQIGGHGRKGI
eukprot:668633-Pelagomonas_calceolata.AAC.1